jgi:adenylate cyclase
MPRWVRLFIDLGVDQGYAPAERRRVQTINLIAVGAIFFNSVYNLLPLFVGFDHLGLVFVTNLASICLYAGVLGLNARRLTEMAMYLALGAALFNLVVAGLVFGIGTGVWLFLVTVPAVGVLLAPTGATHIQVAFAACGLGALVIVILARPSVPSPIEGTPFETVMLVASVVGTVALLTVIGMHHRYVADTAEVALREAHALSERLLHNTLPVEIAERLKQGELVIADRADEVSILFADLVGSTPLSERLTPDEMVSLLNDVFGPFDDLADRIGVEKIKTVGDAYMVVGGLPAWRPDHLEVVVEMALAMRDELARHEVAGLGPLQMRFGIHTGSVVAGVIGKRKFSYDLWGDAVNTAARMESHGVPGEIQVTEEVFKRLRGSYQIEPRGLVEIKGKGPMPTYFLRDRIASQESEPSF